jgi:hypothetical protein
MKAKLAFLVLVVSTIAAVPVFAHHSFAAEFDENKPVTLKGPVSKVEWENPHVYFYIDVKDDKGAVVTWGFEGGSPAQLLRSGWTHTTLKVGDQVVVDGFLSKDGAHLVGTRSVTLADGTKLRGGAGAPGDFGPSGQNGDQ